MSKFLRIVGVNHRTAYRLIRKAEDAAAGKEQKGPSKHASKPVEVVLERITKRVRTEIGNANLWARQGEEVITRLQAWLQDEKPRLIAALAAGPVPLKVKLMPGKITGVQVFESSGASKKSVRRAA
jgi:hypothetical protein